MHPDIEKAISAIDDKITELRNAKRTLIDLFGKPQQQELIEQPLAVVQPIVANKHSTIILKKKQVGAEGTTNKQETYKLLREKGPLTRGEIRTSVSYPSGSISWVLQDAKLFEKRGEKYYARDDIGKEQSEES